MVYFHGVCGCACARVCTCIYIHTHTQTYMHILDMNIIKERKTKPTLVYSHELYHGDFHQYPKADKAPHGSIRIIQNCPETRRHLSSQHQTSVRGGTQANTPPFPVRCVSLSVWPRPRVSDSRAPTTRTPPRLGPGPCLRGTENSMTARSDAGTAPRGTPCMMPRF